MWSLYRTSKETHSRPSALMQIDDPLTAYLLDAAVTTFGVVVENALQETYEAGVGKNKTRHRRYSLTQLLDPAFFLPEPVRPAQGARGLLAWAGAAGRGIRVLKEKAT